MTDPSLLSSTQKAASLDHLFGGAARLGLLLGALDIPWERVAPFVALFPAQLSDEFELGMAQLGAPLWLRTRGDGKAMTYRLARFMEQHGTPQPRLRRLLLSAKQPHHQHLLFDIGFDQGGPQSFAWFTRQPFTLNEARAWLAADGVPAQDIARLARIAKELGKTGVHAVGEAWAKDGQTSSQVVLTTPTDGASWPRLERAARQAGVDDTAWDLVEHHRLKLAQRPTRFVLEFRDGQCTAVRLDIDNIDPELLHTHTDPTWSQRVAMLVALARRPRLHRACFRIATGQELQCQAWTRVQDASAAG